MVRSTASWWDSFAHVAALTALAPASRVWLPGPPTSTMTLFAAVLTATTGAARTDVREQATHAHLTPLQLARALDAGWSPAGVHLTVAGDRLPVGLHDRAVAAGATVSHYFGSSEQSFVVWGAHAEDLRPFPGVEVEVRDGTVWARSAYLFRRYDGPPGPARTDARGFVSVGDRGARYGDRLVVHGRGGDAVLTGGATVLVADVEAALRPAVRGEVLVLGTPHPDLGQVVTAVLTDPADLPAARAAAQDRLAPAQRPRRWHHLAGLPSTAAGKADRAAVRALLADGRAARITPRATMPG